TVCRTAEDRIAGPRTAPQYTIFASLWSLWIGNLLGGIAGVPVLAPLPDVAMHVMQPPSIGGETAHRHGLLSICSPLSGTIDEVAVVVGLLGGNRFAKVKRCLCPGTTGIFPFRLRWQAIRFIVLVA